MLRTVTAPFAAQLCGYRTDGNPSTSDRNDKGSIAWGHALFRQLGVPKSATPVERIGGALELAAFDDLCQLRKDVDFRRSAPGSKFEQYRHLDVFAQFRSKYKPPSDALTGAYGLTETLPKGQDRTLLRRLLKAAERESNANHERTDHLLRAMAQESVLKLDLAVADTADPARLLIGISAKWSLRTDRAQDCVAQGHKLASLRRGHMPHFAVLTMEPRPTMLKLIAYGSGTVDCIYHLALPELLLTADDLVENATPSDLRTYSEARDTLAAPDGRAGTGTGLLRPRPGSCPSHS